MLRGKLVVGVALVLSLVVSTTYATDVLTKIHDSKTITIGYRDAVFPFSFLDQDKKPNGYAIDLCLKISDAIKRHLKLSQINIVYVPVTSTNRVTLIETGKIDLECGSTTNTAERRKRVAFTIPHFIAATRMLVKADSGIKNWSDLRNKKVVVTKGATNLHPLNGRARILSLNLTVLEEPDHNASFAMLDSRAADAFVLDDVLLYGLRALAKTPSNYSVVGDSLTTESYAIMLTKGDPAFKAVVDREMGRIIQDGNINQLYAKWFLNPVPARNNVNLNMPMSHLFKDSLQFPSDYVDD